MFRDPRPLRPVALTALVAGAALLPVTMRTPAGERVVSPSGKNAVVRAASVIPPRSADSGTRSASETPADSGIPFKSIRPDSADAVRWVPSLIGLMTEARAPETQRRQAALLLGRMGRRAAPAVPHLAELLRRTRNRLRASVESAGDERTPDLQSRLLWELKAVSLFGPVAAVTAEEIIEIAEDVRMPLAVRQAAYEALARIGPAAPGAVSALAKALTRPRFAPSTSAADRTFFRATVVECAALLGDAAAPLLPTLIRLLDEADELIRRNALLCLAALGRRAAAAQPAVFRVLLFDGEPAVRETAAATLARLGPSTLGPLARLLEEPMPETRRLAAMALQQHPDVRHVLTALRRRWSRESDAVTWVTLAETICDAAPAEADAVVPGLLKRWDSLPRSVRIRVYRLLQRMSARHASVRVAIRAHLPRNPPAVLRRLADDRGDGQ
ncbi:MAG: HEAT repeat domain-containing protein [Planctomycetota bacterium]|nr:MAG: HEAT repeat domain-containing protein [Planctomycetota bacterium]